MRKDLLQSGPADGLADLAISPKDVMGASGEFSKKEVLSSVIYPIEQ